MRLWVVFAIMGAVACLPRRPDSRAMQGYSMSHQPLTQIKSISAGTLHTCALDTIGRVQCWGQWKKRVSDPIIPTYVLQDYGVRIHKITQISAGSRYNCAVTTSGNVQCWGEVRSAHMDIATPIHTADGNPLGNVAQVSVEGDNACALTTSGHVKCWDNKENVPTEVLTSNKKPLDNIVQVSVGSEHTCALTKTSHVKCWGSGEDGQLGNGANEASKFPVDVITADSKPLANVVQISAGSHHTCALTKTSHVKCWGSGEIGQLGNGDSKNSNRAVDAITPNGKLANIKQVGAGITHSCALTNTGHVKCWGAGKAGQMGNGVEGVDEGRKSPVDVTAVASGGHELLANITQIAVGGLHTCALTTASQVKCWGDGKVGQLGYGTDKDGVSRNRYRAVYVRH